jgi:hypothetical protein
VPIGKESDQIEENEYIGEEAGPLEHPLTAKDHAELVAFIAETKELRNITDRVLLGRAGVSPHTLRKLRNGLPVSDKSLFQLARAAEQLRQETESVAAVNARWIQKLRGFVFAAEPFTGHAGRVNSVGFSPDGTRIVSGGFDGRVRLWTGRTDGVCWINQAMAKRIVFHSTTTQGRVAS